MFRRVLVANRGEIAVRIIRACRDLGVSPVTVHSEADRDSLHVRLADESFEVGGAASRDSYLNGERVIEAARAMEAEALHPGYGFLAENGGFAARCAERGLVFVGPPPEAMRRMGDKAAARATAVEAGVPVVPGSDIVSGKDAERAAPRIGFPLLIKAVAGGGGMGMRLVRDPSEFSDSLRAAESEAEAAFGDARVFLERFVENPRHIEIQVFGDDFGSVVHLGERDCSIQRRNQKLLEESPSPAISPGLRAAMGEAAVRLARGAGYRNAGTVEFLLAPEGRFHFLEMNARLQVEHPVTELVSGMDLVALQLRVAAGEPLGFAQSEVSLSGAAIELRITAEDPFTGFVPATGRIREFRAPAGPGVRCDAGIDWGSVVSPHYDPLLAKIIVSGPDRETARRRAIRAVRETRLVGVASTLPFFERVLASAPFRSGDLDTSFVAVHWSALSRNGADGESAARAELAPLALAAAAGELWRREGANAGVSGAPPSGWRLAGVAEAQRDRL
ncbi:MAG: acetyl-CoA carboxylase biotin carboxylase subunit [Acidobacteriota bacterium]|nr:acetyl-CoA carboxylase biotin carboxylase subunit [Acidobacteriota bacterium]